MELILFIILPSIMILYLTIRYILKKQKPLIKSDSSSCNYNNLNLFNPNSIKNKNDESSKNFFEQTHIHKELIKTPFKLSSYIEENLNRHDLVYLKKYGTWLESLEKGDIQPITEAQENFLRVCEGTILPTKKIEKAWYNYKKISRRKIKSIDYKHSFGINQISSSIKSNPSSMENKCNACYRPINFCTCGN